MPTFDPNVDDVVSLFGEPLKFLPLPGLPHLPYAAEGGRGRVYRVRGPDGSDRALKLFNAEFRDESIVHSTKRLAAVAKLDGLRAASRRVVTEEAVWRRGSDDLKYAVIMPWIEGETWWDVLLKGRTGKSIPTHLALPLAKRFVYVMHGLESSGLAHCDISSGNVAVDFSGSAPTVELLDLEDMYLPGASAPTGDYVGSPGYQHRSGKSVWGPAGDRFAATIMAAEMLVMSDPAMARLATESGFFGKHATSGTAATRFDHARAWIEERFPQFTPCLDRAWRSLAVDECPSIAELHTALENTHLEHEVIPIGHPKVTFLPWDLDLSSQQPTSTTGSTTASNRAGKASQGPFAPPPTRSAWASVTPSQPPTPSATAPSAYRPPSDTPLQRAAKVMRDYPVIPWLILAAAVVAAVHYLT